MLRDQECLTLLREAARRKNEQHRIGDDRPCFTRSQLETATLVTLALENTTSRDPSSFLERCIQSSNERNQEWCAISSPLPQLSNNPQWPFSFCDRAVDFTLHYSPLASSNHNEDEDGDSVMMMLEENKNTCNHNSISRKKKAKTMSRVHPVRAVEDELRACIEEYQKPGRRCNDKTSSSTHPLVKAGVELFLQQQQSPSPEDTPCKGGGAFAIDSRGAEKSGLEAIAKPTSSTRTSVSASRLPHVRPPVVVVTPANTTSETAFSTPLVNATAATTTPNNIGSSHHHHALPPPQQADDSMEAHRLLHRAQADCLALSVALQHQTDTAGSQLAVLESRINLATEQRVQQLQDELVQANEQIGLLEDARLDLIDESNQAIACTRMYQRFMASHQLEPPHHAYVDRIEDIELEDADEEEEY